MKNAKLTKDGIHFELNFSNDAETSPSMDIHITLDEAREWVRKLNTLLDLTPTVEPEEFIVDLEEAELYVLKRRVLSLEDSVEEAKRSLEVANEEVFTLVRRVDRFRTRAKIYASTLVIMLKMTEEIEVTNVTHNMPLR